MPVCSLQSTYVNVAGAEDGEGEWEETKAGE